MLFSKVETMPKLSSSFTTAAEDDHKHNNIFFAINTLFTISRGYPLLETLNDLFQVITEPFLSECQLDLWLAHCMTLLYRLSYGILYTSQFRT